MASQDRSCAVCDTVLTPHQARAGFLCSSLACQWAYAREPSRKRCSSCGRALTLSELTADTCARGACQHAVFARAFTAYTANTTEREAAIVARFRARAEPYRDECAATIGIENASAYTLALVPANTAVEAAMPAGRRAAFAEHVRHLAEEAFDARIRFAQRLEHEATDRLYADLVMANRFPADVAALVMQGCISCRGNCCSHGDTHAYLTREAMNDFIEANPGCTVESVVDAYVSHIGERTLEDGCVFQGEHGCSLPPHMRSAICHNFFCSGLQQFIAEQRHATPPGEPARAFIVHGSDLDFRRGIFATAELVQIVHVREGASQEADNDS